MSRSRHGIVSAEAGEDARAVQASLAAAPQELRRLLDDTAADQLSGAWYDELSKRPAISRAQSTFVLADSAALPVSAGLKVSTGERRESLGRIYEFGTNDREKRSPVRGSRRRRAHFRHTRRQLPPRKPGGYIAYPAANALGVRVFAMWSQLIRKVLHDATEGSL